MWILCNLCLVVSFTASVYSQNDVRKPPSITKGPSSEDFFSDKREVDLACKAGGTPPLTYVWKKNGVDLDMNHRNIGTKTEGDIVIKEATRLDDGFYQCFASNHYGTALSNVSHVRGAFLDTAPHSEVNITVKEGQPFVIPACRRNSFPDPTYNWDIVIGIVDPKPRKFSYSPRVQSAFNGDLHFAFAEKSDDQGGSLYNSIVFNPYAHLSLGGNYTRVTVEEGSGLPSFSPPNITYLDKSREVALVGRDIQLKCFASGNPLPVITWSGPKNNLPSRRYGYPSSNYGTSLDISNITESDEGEYVCTAKNSQGTTSQTLNIRVEAAPAFKNLYDGPRDVNVTEGDSITFNCSAYAKPNATVVWLRNGQPIDVNNHNAPTRFAFSNDSKSLTIRDVCRDCRDHERQTDLMVVQCNASNVHGYAFASGYLNVLLRTKVTLQPNTAFVSVDPATENRFPFECCATSDPSTPPSVRWYKVVEYNQESVFNVAKCVYVKDGSLTIYSEPNRTCQEHFGEYRCIGDNKYTRDTVTVIVNGTIETTVEPPKDASLNWIVIGMALVFFVLLLLLLWCIIYRRRKGDEYNVDAKERKSGRNMEEEIQANAFQDFYPSVYVKRKGSPGSMGSTVMFRGLDEVIEYDDFDDDKNFAEDGSFVGKYA